MVDQLKKKLAFLKADLFKVFSFTAISTLVKMFTGLISVKVVAILIGPSGIALLGQLNNFASIAMIVASAGINNGIAEYRESKEDIQKLLSTALKITVLASLLCGFTMVAFNQYLSRKVMLSEDYGYVFLIFGISIVLYALNALIASILNGFKEFKLFVYVSIAGSILGLIFTLAFVFFWGLKGALISAVSFQSVMFFVSLYMVRKLDWAKSSFFNLKIDKDKANKYLKYSLMTLVTAITAPVAQMALRGYVISSISAVEAGWWEGMNRISNMYLLVITTSFSVYYLPRLSEITDDKELRLEILKAFKIVVPILLMGFTVVYFSRFLVIRLLFSNEFLGMEKLFIWQLLGDFFKICSWLLAYLMIAKTMTKQFIISEIFFTALFLAIAFYLIGMTGTVGITQAYTINYFAYFIAMVFLFRSILFNKVVDA
jgi:O-antigen/teichoic acid export membrane protein